MENSKSKYLRGAMGRERGQAGTGMGTGTREVVETAGSLYVFCWPESRGKNLKLLNA